HKEQRIQWRTMKNRRTAFFKDITIAGSKTSCELNITVIARTKISAQPRNRRNNKKNDTTKEKT
ncbi:MAG: hypothetical protein KJ757_00475, partial [Planctomycetes bacterium]|nr:hypothetical protein [Planctomycetota bacterium]